MMELHKNAVDLTGAVIGKLTVIEPSHREARGIFWRCECSCGNTTYTASAGDLRSGRISSCGCFRNSQEFADMLVVHGGRRQRKGTTSRAYVSWCEMKRRCNDPSRENYRWYGGKGIGYCERWEDFKNFLADMGECPEGLELDRYPNNQGNYEPGNCRWTTHAENCANRGGKFSRD